MRIENFKPFNGVHCETTAAGCLLLQLGIELSESMLFGLGEGLGFIYWNMKSMDVPFIGGRIKPDLLTQNLCRNLDLALDVKETASLKKAWTNVAREIDNGVAIGLKLDCYHLEYFTSKIHFAGHYAVMHGYDDESAYLVDTVQQGGMVKTTLENLALARSEKGPMSSKNLSFCISKPKALPELATAARTAIVNNAKDYLNPPITNIGYKGVLKLSREVKKWFARSTDIRGNFQLAAMLMEKAGTGGSLFRNLYRDFLKESSEFIDDPILLDAHEDFVAIAKRWKQVAALFHQASETSDLAHINHASEILIDLSEREKRAMERLAGLAKS